MEAEAPLAGALEAAEPHEAHGSEALGCVDALAAGEAPNEPHDPHEDGAEAVLADVELAPTLHELKLEVAELKLKPPPGVQPRVCFFLFGSTGFGFSKGRKIEGNNAKGLRMLTAALMSAAVSSTC